MGLHASPKGAETLAQMGTTAKRAAVATLVAGGILVLALALWKVKVVIALFFLGMIIAAAMRPGIDWLQRHARIPRGLGVLIHFAALAGLVALFLWLIVPPAISQVQQAIGGSALHHEAVHSSGFKHEILSSLDKRLRNLPSGSKLLHPAITVTKTAFEVLVGIFFMFAVAAYWIFERDNTIALVQSLSPRKHRRVVRDTWILIDHKLGASVLSAGFWLIGLPYWLLVGTFAGVFELIPIIGPLPAGAVAVGIGLTQSWQMGLYAGLIVLVVRQLEDYLIVPRVMGHAVGLSPLVVLTSVTTIGILFGGFYVLVAIPIAAVLATLVDVVLRDVDPAEQEVPTVLFPGAKEEAG